MDPSPQAGQRFTRTRLRPGYKVAEVDALMERADAGTITVADVEAARFGSTRGGEGYDEAEVDAALDALVARLRAEGRLGEPASPGTSRSLWSRLLGREG